MYQDKKAFFTCCAEELDDVLLAGLALVKGTWVGSETNKKWHYKPHNNHVIHLFILVFFNHISWLNIFLKFSSLSLYISLVLLCFDGGSEWGVGWEWECSGRGWVNTYTCTVWPGCSLRGDSNSPCSVPPVVSSLQWQKTHPLFRIPWHLIGINIFYRGRWWSALINICLVCLMQPREIAMNI